MEIEHHKWPSRNDWNSRMAKPIQGISTRRFTGVKYRHFTTYFPWVNEIIDKRKLQVMFRGSISRLRHSGISIISWRSLVVFNFHWSLVMTELMLHWLRTFCYWLQTFRNFTSFSNWQWVLNLYQATCKNSGNIEQWKLNTTSDLQEMIEIPEWRSHEGFQSFLEGHEWCSIHWSRVMTELITLFSIQGISTRRFTGGKYRHHCCFPSFLALFWFFIWHIAISRVFFAEIISLKSTLLGKWI